MPLLIRELEYKVVARKPIMRHMHQDLFIKERRVLDYDSEC
jgi:hypothetical protein